MVELFDLGDSYAIFMPSPFTHITGLLYGVLLPADAPGPERPARHVGPGRAASWWSRRRAGSAWVPRRSCRVSSTAYRRRAHSQLRVFACGGADVPPELVRRARGRARRHGRERVRLVRVPDVLLPAVPTTT